MDTLGFKLMSIGSAYYSAIYAFAFIMRIINNEWACSKWIPLQFPLLNSWNLDKTGTLFNLGLWMIVSPIMAIGIWQQNQYIIMLMAVISAWEIFLGASFYVQLGHGFKEHMILHSLIFGYIISKYV